MKKTILSFGLIAGAIVATMMTVSAVMCQNDPNFKGSEVIGYTGMLVAFSFVFLGIKNFRDKKNDGVVSFGKAFKIGILITLIASTAYVIVWLFEYYFIFPDFMDKYAAGSIRQAQESGLSTAEIKDKIDNVNMMKEWYKNPLLIILMTFLEVFPIGLLVTLISALILKKKARL